MTVRHVTPTKTLPEGARQGAYVPGSRQITSRVPVELPAGLSHGSDSGYGRFGCRCEPCRAWKAASTARYKARRAAKAAGQSWGSPADD